MGNQASQLFETSNKTKVFIDQSLEDFEHETTFFQEITDASFGPVQIFKRRDLLLTPTFIMEKQIISSSKVEFANLSAEAQARLQIQHPNYLSFLGYEFINAKDFCSESNHGRLFFEYHYHDLQKEIQRRASCEPTEYFSENDLQYIMKSLVGVCAFLQQQGLFHGDLRPQGIKITNEGVVKIGDHGLINSLKNGFYKAFIQREHSYLSPIQLSYLSQGLTEAKYNVFKQDVFSLGLTLLEAASLQNIEALYDWDKLVINQEQLNSLLAQAAENYSNELIAILNLMLQLEDSFRPDFVQLLAHIQTELSDVPAVLSQQQNSQNIPAKGFQNSSGQESISQAQLEQSRQNQLLGQNNQLQQQQEEEQKILDNLRQNQEHEQDQGNLQQSQHSAQQVMAKQAQKQQQSAQIQQQQQQQSAQIQNQQQDSNNPQSQEEFKKQMKEKQQQQQQQQQQPQAIPNKAPLQKQIQPQTTIQQNISQTPPPIIRMLPPIQILQPPVILQQVPLLHVVQQPQRILNGFPIIPLPNPVVIEQPQIPYQFPIPRNDVQFSFGIGERLPQSKGTLVSQQIIQTAQFPEQQQNLRQSSLRIFPQQNAPYLQNSHLRQQYTEKIAPQQQRILFPSELGSTRFGERGLALNVQSGFESTFQTQKQVDINENAFRSGNTSTIRFQQEIGGQQIQQQDGNGQLARNQQYQNENNFQSTYKQQQQGNPNEIPTDLDRRVRDALELTQQTIKKNQQIPNIFSE